MQDEFDVGTRLKVAQAAIWLISKAVGRSCERGRTWADLDDRTQPFVTVCGFVCAKYWAA